ncbi:MAG: hypothetical protein M1275_01395 [Patescibacteria group bacterium]|nr:hypothetical protein [Patescibacteria group bacterium]
MNKSVEVPDFLRATFRRWRNTPSQGEIPILRKVRPRGAHIIAIVCGDDRLHCQTESHLISLCEGGAFWPVSIAGGALDLTHQNSVLPAYEIMLQREVEKFLSAKHVPEDAPVDILALGHVDCGFARVNSLSPLQQFRTLLAAKWVLQELFFGPRFEVRAGFHVVWGDQQQRTYELDVPAAINDLEVHPLPPEPAALKPAAGKGKLPHAWSMG